MQKKVLALAVAGALTPAAAMAQSTVEIYGRANLGLDYWRATGSSVTGGDLKGRTRIFDGSSRLGFRVNEPLGGGMRAFIVLETGVSIDTGNNSGQSGATNTSAGFWASRDSYVGVGGGWGDVRFGRQSIWWSNGIIAQTGANYINQAVDGLTTGGFGAVAVPVARQSNVVSYNTPTVGGFNASFSYSSDPFTEGATYTGTGQEKETVWGVTGRYASGPLRAQFDYATRGNVGGVNDRDRNGWKAGLGWAYAPGSQISGVVGRLENENHASLFGAGNETRKVRIQLVNWEHMLGQWQLLAQYFWSGKVDGLNADPGETRTKAFTVGAKYFLSKRTGVYGSLSNIRNEANAWSDLTGGGYSSGPGGGLSIINRGADPRILAVGVMHNF